MYRSAARRLSHLHIEFKSTTPLPDPFSSLRPLQPSLNTTHVSSLRTVASTTLCPLSTFKNPAWRAATPQSTQRSFASLGIVDKLSDEVAITLPATASRFWEVIEFKPDSVVETWKSPDSLGLHPRDVHLFASTSIAQRAMIAPRGDAILVRTEFVKAIIYADKAVLFPSRRHADTLRIAQAIKSSVSQPSVLPFEFKVLESLLSETFRAFEIRVKRLGMVAQTVMEDINHNFSASVAELHRLIPVTRKMTEVQNDIKETVDAIADILNDDNQLQCISLTERRRALKALKQQQEKQKPPPPSSSPLEKAQNPSTKPGISATGSTTTTMSTMPLSTAAAAAAAAAAASSAKITPPEQLQPPPPPAAFSTDAAHYTNNHGTNTSSGSTNNNPTLSDNQYNNTSSERHTGYNAGYAGHSSSYFDTAKHDAAGIGSTTSGVGVGGNVAGTPKRSVAMLMASRILESYEHKLMSAHGTMKEHLETIEQAQSVWHMQLDHQRNRVLRLNLMISIFSLSGLLVTLPAAFFGMNLTSGLENELNMFWPIVQMSLTGGALTAAGTYGYFKYGPKVRYNARLRDMRSLRDLLFFHMDDMEEVIEALQARGPVTKRDFASIVRGVLKDRPMSSDEVSLLFRVFDQNKDDLLEMSELVKMEDQFDKLDADEEAKWDMSHHVT